MLGDFGAASPLVRGGMRGEGLQRLEVRAFGVLLGELIERCDGDAGSGPVLEELALLRDRCLVEVPGARPLFGEVSGRLASLMC